MKTQSAKAKGRRFQQWVRDLLIEKLEVHPEDIESRSMGAGGEDLIMARAARKKFPYSIECKNQEAVNVWKSYEQAKENSNGYEKARLSFEKARLPRGKADIFLCCFLRGLLGMIEGVSAYRDRGGLMDLLFASRTDQADRASAGLSA